MDNLPCLTRPVRLALVLAAVLSSGACSESLQQALQPDQTQNFGEQFFNIMCQRVAYTSSRTGHQASLAANKKDPSVPVRPLDVSGQEYRLACRYGPQHLPAHARARDPKVWTLVDGRNKGDTGPSNRKLLVDALNNMFLGSSKVSPTQEAKLLSDVQDYLVKILPLTDNDLFPNVVRKGASFIKTKVEQNTVLHDSLARLDTRLGYRPRQTALGVPRELLAYKDLHNLLNTVLAFAGVKGEGHASLMALVDALGFELRSMRRVDDPKRKDPVHQATRDRTLRLTLDLLLSQHQDFKSKNGALLLARRDWRGVVNVLASAGGVLPSPFQDKNKDKQADIDSLGRFITVGGKVPPAPFHHDKTVQDTAARRDSLGRALTSAGKPVYDYVDLDATLLAALARDAVDILDYKKDIAFGVLLGLPPMLGQRKTMTMPGRNESMTYKGYDANKSPLLELVHALTQTMRDPNIDATLDAAVQLMKKHAPEAARLVDAVLDARERGKAHPEAAMDPRTTLWDDAVPLVAEMVNTKGLVEDLMKALGSPGTKNLGQMISNYMLYRDVHVLDKNNKKVVAAGGGMPGFKSKVIRTIPDGTSGHAGDNRSIQQRLTHIIHNTTDMKMCNKKGGAVKVLGITVLGPFKECELFKVDDGALLYTQSIARLRDSKGNLTNTPKGHLKLNLPSNIKAILDGVEKNLGIVIKQDAILEFLSGITGMTTHPTTEALNRLMFMSSYPKALSDLQDPPKDIDGHLITSYHQGSLVSWEVKHPGFSCSATDPCTFFDAFRPIVQAFADHNKERLFLDLLGVFHHHWASKKNNLFQFTNPKGKDYATGSALVNWEVFLAEVLAQTDLMAGLQAASPKLVKLKLSSGASAIQALNKTLAYVTDPTASPVLAYRDGKKSVLKSDGKTTVTCGKNSIHCVTPFYLFADAFAAKRAAMRSCAFDCPACGDGICSVGEGVKSCPKDCTLSCGDNKCAASENARSCPRDCLGKCGDGLCNRSANAAGKVVQENYSSCHWDCPLACSDGKCSAAERNQKTASDSWDRSVSDLADVFLETLGKGTTTRFKNKKLPAVAEVVVGFLRKRLAVHRAKKDLVNWLSVELPDELVSKLKSPVIPGAVDFLRLVEGDSKVRKSIYDLASFLIDEVNQNPAFRSSLTGIADVAQLLLDDLNLVPLARVMGDALARKAGLIDAALRFLQPSIKVDTKKTLSTILANAWSESDTRPGESPISTIFTLATEVHRKHPGAGTDFVGQDFAQTFLETRDFLANGETGLEKFFEIVKSRCGGYPCQSK